MTHYAYDVQAHGHGKQLLHISRPHINRRSKVFASISEYAGDVDPFVGAARMTVHNVSPHDDSTVHVWCSIEWGSDLLYTINLFVVNN